MPALICNLPSYHVWVRKEYLTDHKSGHGEFVEGLNDVAPILKQTVVEKLQDIG